MAYFIILAVLLLVINLKAETISKQVRNRYFSMKKGERMKFNTIIKRSLGVFLVVLTVFTLIPMSNVEAASIRLNKKQAVMAVGSHFKLSANTKQRVEWISSNSRIATVTSFGQVKAQREGNTTIYGKINNKVLTCKVIIDNPRLSPDKIQIKTGEAVLIEALSTSTARRKGDWYSTDTNVVYVEDGEVIGISPGKAEIIYTSGFDCELISEVTVEDKLVEVTSILIKESIITMDTINETHRIFPELYPVESRNTNQLQWQSSNPSVVTVENGTIRAISTGSATISVSARNGKTASCMVIVAPNIEPQRFFLSESELRINDMGEKAYLFVNTNTDSYPNDSFMWSSSDPSIASVDQLGTVTAWSNGKAIITAKINGYEASCHVTVTLQETVSPYLSTAYLQLTELGELDYIQCFINNLPVDGDQIQWISDHESVATVKKGEICAVATGNARIWAILPNGATLNCVVRVLIPSAQNSTS